MKQHLSFALPLWALVACGQTAANDSSPNLPPSTDVTTTATAATTSSTTSATQTPSTVAPVPPPVQPSGVPSVAPTTVATQTTEDADTSSRVGNVSTAASEEQPTDVASSAPEASTNTVSSEAVSTEDLLAYASGFHELYLHDECTDDDPSDDVCAHERVHEVPFTFGGDTNVTYAVKLRIRGLFEPTNLAGGETPYPEHPYFKVGGTVTKTDYSQWQIRVGEPAVIYYLNHYPATGHTIYKEDFEATLEVRGGASVVVRVEDANDRQIDNGYVGLQDRQQTIEGVTDGVVDGQVLRLDVLDVSVSP